MSGYDKRVRVGVDADAAVDSAIDKLLKVKKLEDDLDGRKATVTAKLKVDTSEVDKLQKQSIKIPAIIEATTKSSLSDNTKKNIIAQVKQIEGIINKAISSGYQASFQALPKGLYTLNAQEVRAVRDWTTKRIPAGANGYDELYNQRYEYSRATKWALQQGENAKPINRSDFQTNTDYLEAVKAQDKLLTIYKQNLSNIKTLYESLGSPSSTHFVKPNNRQITAILSELSASVEQSKNAIASTFDFSGLQEAINTGNKDMAKAAMISIQETMDFITAETDKVAQKIRSDKSFNTKKRGIRTAIDYMFENISEATADESRDILRDVFKDFLAGNKSAYDLSVHNTGKLLRSFAVYKNKGGTGLSNKELEQLNTVVNDLLDDPENGKFWSEAYPRLEEAIRNPVVEKPVETSKTTTATPAPTNGTVASKNASSSKGAVYDHIVHSDYSTRNKTDAIDKLRLANEELDAIESNLDIPDRSLIRLEAAYKARQYYVEALKQGIEPKDLNELSPFLRNNTSLNSAILSLKGMKERLSFYSDIYSQIESFDSSLLSHRSVTNAADALAYQLFYQDRQYLKGALTEDDLDHTEQYEDILIKKIQDKSGKKTDGLYFIPNTAALRDSLNNHTSDNTATTAPTSAAPVTNAPQAAQQEKEVEKAATAASTSVNHVNNTVTSAVQNTTEKLDKMTESTERLGTAVQNTTHNQEKAAKKEKTEKKKTVSSKANSEDSAKSVAISQDDAVTSESKQSTAFQHARGQNNLRRQENEAKRQRELWREQIRQRYAAVKAEKQIADNSSVYNKTSFDDFLSNLRAERLSGNFFDKSSRISIPNIIPAKDNVSKVISSVLSDTASHFYDAFETAADSFDDSIKRPKPLNSDYGKLYSSPTNPPEIKNWEQLRQSKSANGKEQTKVYLGSDKGVYTLSQKYVENRDKNTGEITSSGYLNFLSNSFDFKKFKQETTGLVSDIFKLKGELKLQESKGATSEDLDRIRSGITEKRKTLRDNIDLAKVLDQDKSNDFSLSGFIRSIKENTQDAQKAYMQTLSNVSDIREKTSVKNATDPYNEAIKRAQELNKINNSILSTQKELDATRDQSARSQLQSDLNAAKSRKQILEKELTDFRESQKNQFGPQTKAVSDALEKSNNAFEQAMRNANISNSKIGNYEQAKNIADFTSQYDSAIAKVKELKQAQVDLMNAQNEYKINSTDNAVAQRFEDAKQRVEALKTEVDSFYKDTYTRDKDNNGILNTKKANEYEKAYLSAQTAESNYHKNLVADMKEQYSLQTKAERELIKLSASDKYSQQEHMLLSAAQARAKQSYENMYKEVSQIYGKDYADTQMQDFISQSNVSKNNTINSNFASLSKDIDSFVSKIQNAGRASESFKSQFSSLSSGLDTATTEFKNGSISVNDYVSRMLELRNQTEAYKDYYQNGLGVKDLDYFQAHEKLIKYTNIGDKTGFYQAKLDGFHSRYEELNDTFKNSTKGQKDIEAYSKGIDELVASMEKFGKTSDGLNKTTSKGTMIENTAHQIKDTADASKALTDYAASIGLTNKISQSINNSTGKVTMNFETASGDIVKLTGNIEKANDSLRVMYENTTKASTGFTSFNQGIKGLVSGNFKGALNDIAMYVGNIQIMYKAINQMKQGFNTFMDYNKALTTISYTMDMSKSQLQNLGSSAVDMAKDLSMSLDNTMDIYQIYANMNTTSKEIQETAKPTAILSNLSGVDASTAADQVQGILQQFHMLEDGSTSAADASMHVVDVLDKISANVGMDYAKFLAHILEIIYCSQTKIGED